jgi:mitogen-activated protein kinase kinase kinase
MGGICTKQPLVKSEHVLGNSVKNQMEKLETKEDVQILKKTSQMSYRSEKYQIINDDEIEDNNYFDDKSSSDHDRILNLKDNRIPESDTNTSAWYNPKYNFEYIKGEHIGSGKLGRVYSGLSLNTGEIVAIKCVTLDLKKEIEKQILDINEAVYKIGQLDHKNIIKYLCTQPSSSNPDEIEVISEFCNGGSIKQILEKFDVLDEKLIKLYVKQILDGLVYLHERNIIHRNIKNCNILIDGNGTVKLSDFIVSKIIMGNDPDAILAYNTNNGLGKLIFIYLN